MNKIRFMSEISKLDSLDHARQAVKVAEERQAIDISLLDLRDLSAFTDFFVIATVESRRQLKAIAEELDQALTRSGAYLHHREGSPDGGWILLDMGGLVIHVFGSEERGYYQLDSLWSHAPTLLRVV